MLHHDIVMMSIRTQVVALPEAPLQAGSRHTLLPPVGRHAVDGAIRSIVQPCPIFYARVVGIFSGNEAECACYFPFFILAHVAVCLLYFVLHQFGRRVAVNPLVGVSVGLHEAAGVVERMHDFFQILKLRKSDSHIVCTFLIGHFTKNSGKDSEFIHTFVAFVQIICIFAADFITNNQY